MDAHRRELGLEDNDEYPLWRLHPNSPGCPLTKGRNFYIFWYFDHNFLLLIGSM